MEDEEIALKEVFPQLQVSAEVHYGVPMNEDLMYFVHTYLVPLLRIFDHCQEFAQWRLSIQSAIKLLPTWNYDERSLLKEIVLFLGYLTDSPRDINTRRMTKQLLMGFISHAAHQKFASRALEFARDYLTKHGNSATDALEFAIRQWSREHEYFVDVCSIAAVALSEPTTKGYFERQKRHPWIQDCCLCTVL